MLGKQRLSILFFALVVTSFCAGCLPKKVEEKREQSLPPLNILNFPVKDVLPLGQAMCFIQGEKSTQFQAPYAGVIKLNVLQSKSRIEKGFVWGELSAEEINAELKAHLDQKSTLDLKENHYSEFEKPKEILQLERDLMKAKEELKNFEVIYKEMSSDQLDELIPSASQLIELDPEAYERSLRQVSLLAKALEQLSKNEATPTELNFLKERKQWNRTLDELERKKELSQFAAPFSGELTLNFPLFKDKVEYSVSSGQAIASLRSFESLLVKVQAIDPRWLLIPEDKLSLSIQNGGINIEADFYEKRIEDNRMREETVMVFKVREKDLGNAVKLVGSNLTAKISRKLETKAHILPKFSVYLHHPEVSGVDWDTDVKELFTGYSLLAEGESDLAVVAP
jgi:hypothetical protein